MEQFGASRVTVREALRTLEHSGLVEIRRGAEGGAFVSNPDSKFVSSFLQDMFSLGNITIKSLMEARLSVEPYSVELAAKRIDGNFLEQIRLNIIETKGCLERGNQNDSRLLNLEFHRIVAQASGNLVIFLMIDSIMDVMENNISAIPLSVKPVERTTKYHDEIYLAIKNRDAKTERDLMFKHIQEIHEALELLNKKTLIEKGVTIV